jgi:thymidine phosphorylase
MSNATPEAVIPARLSLRQVRIDTYHENVAYMHRDCEVYRAEGFKALSKVEVRTNGLSILATLNVVDDEAIVACGELGLSKAAFAQMGVEDGHTVTVSQAEPPESIGSLYRKLGGERLGMDDFRAIIQDVTEHHYSKIELTAFVVATHRDELDREEVYFLTQAMIDAGRRLVSFSRGLNTIGGIGNRTSMLVLPSSRRTAPCFPKHHRVPLRHRGHR